MIRTAVTALLLTSTVACGPTGVTPGQTPATQAPGQPVSALTSTGCHVVDGRADTHCTPGVRNPQVTQLNLASTICRKGWTATVRPPTSYTEPLKLKQMARYGEPAPASLYELDHIIPLEIGGSPTDPANLFPQPYAGRGAHVKDQEENSLNRAICNGRLTLAEGQAQILRDWTR